MLGHTHARARHHESGNGRDIECGSTVAAGPAGIEQRIQARSIDERCFLPHGARKAQEFLGSLALGSQPPRRRKFVASWHLPLQNGEHGQTRFVGRQILARGNLVQVRATALKGFEAEFSTLRQGVHDKSRSEEQFQHEANCSRSFSAHSCWFLMYSLLNAQGRRGRPQLHRYASRCATPAAGPQQFPAPPAVETKSKTKHEIQINGKKHRLHGDGGHAGPEKGREALGQHVLCRLHAGRRARIPPSVPSRSLSTAARDRLRSGCTWARWGRSAWKWDRKASSPSRPIIWWTTKTPRWSSPTWSSSIR